jgi:hypothetical protein
MQRRFLTLSTSLILMSIAAPAASASSVIATATQSTAAAPQAVAVDLDELIALVNALLGEHAATMVEKLAEAKLEILARHERLAANALRTFTHVIGVQVKVGHIDAATGALLVDAVMEIIASLDD